MNKTDIVRDYFRHNPNATIQDSITALVETVPKRTIQIVLCKDFKAGRAVKIKLGDTYGADYSTYFQKQEEEDETNEWKSEVRRELIEHLLEINRLEKDSLQARTNAKTIDALLQKI